MQATYCRPAGAISVLSGEGERDAKCCYSREEIMRERERDGESRRLVIADQEQQLASGEGTCSGLPLPMVKGKRDARKPHRTGFPV